MPQQINSLPKEKVQKITELLLAGQRNKDVAAAVDVSLGRVSYLRAKMINAGIMDRVRQRRSKRNSPVTKTKTLSVPNTTVVNNVHDFTPVETVVTPVTSGTTIFRINNLEVKISDAAKVHVKNGVIEIKY
jgi:hypothetical protein